MVEDYPRSELELERRFSTDEACRDYLMKLRWTDGFRCIRLDNCSDGANLLANRIPLFGNDNDLAVRSIGGEELAMKSDEVPHVQGVARPVFSGSKFKLLLIGRSLWPGLGSG
jgi:hypothetical protein